MHGIEIPIAERSRSWWLRKSSAPLSRKGVTKFVSPASQCFLDAAECVHEALRALDNAQPIQRTAAWRSCCIDLSSVWKNAW